MSDEIGLGSQQESIQQQDSPYSLAAGMPSGEGLKLGGGSGLRYGDYRASDFDYESSDAGDLEEFGITPAPEGGNIDSILRRQGISDGSGYYLGKPTASSVWKMFDGDPALMGEFKRLNNLGDADMIRADRYYKMPVAGEFDTDRAQTVWDGQERLWDEKERRESANELRRETNRVASSAKQNQAANSTPLLTIEAQRRQSIIDGTPGIIRITENPKASAAEPFYEWKMQEQVTKYSGIIDAKSAELGVDPSLVKAIAYMETTHGWYDSWVAPFDKNSSILPMNVRSDTWGGLGYSREDLKNPEINIEAGIKIIKGITERLENPSVRSVATLYNSLAKDQVTAYGARVDAIYNSKPWNDPSLSQMKDARQSYREQYRAGQYSHPTYNQLLNKK